ncbi:MAG: class I SAM-dependent methyltransferase [Pseudomonadota bacterium]
MDNASTASGSIPGEDGLESVSACLFCGSAHASKEVSEARDHFFGCDAGAFTFNRCHDCDSLWLSQRPFGQRLAAAYSSYYTHETPDAAAPAGIKGRLKQAYIRKQFSSSPRIEDTIGSAIYAMLTPNRSQTDIHYRFSPAKPANILDYGCGSGEYLLRMRDLGHHVSAVDFDAKALASLQNLGIDTVSADEVDGQDWDEHFDHITLSHVIEHVPDPIGLLARLNAWTKPGGTFFIEVPNARATGLDVFGSYWRGLEAPRHFSLPSRTALEHALRKAGFSIVAQHVRKRTRDWMWRASFDAMPGNQGEGTKKAVENAPPEDLQNAEFLTYLCRK